MADAEKILSNAHRLTARAAGKLSLMLAGRYLKVDDLRNIATNLAAAADQVQALANTLQREQQVARHGDRKGQ